MSDAKQNAIPYTKERCLKAAIYELVDDHEALKREVVELREHNKYLESRVSEESDYATLLTRHNALVDEVAQRQETEDSLTKWIYNLGVKYDALVESVKWEREFDEVLVWLVQTGRYPRDMGGKYDLANERECARAEVDRLLGDE